MKTLQTIQKGMQGFILEIFCRTPKFDDTFSTLISKLIELEYNDVGTKYESFRNYLLNPSVSKLNKFVMPSKIIDKIQEDNKFADFFATLNSFKNNEKCFLLGDYPMVYQTEPNKLTDAIGAEVILPISPTRAYSLTQKKDFFLTYQNAMFLNVTIINQSKKYVCSHDRTFLEFCVNYHNQISNDTTHGPLMNYVRQMVFF